MSLLLLFRPKQDDVTIIPPRQRRRPGYDEWHKYGLISRPGPRPRKIRP